MFRRVSALIHRIYLWTLVYISNVFIKRLHPVRCLEPHVKRPPRYHFFTIGSYDTKPLPGSVSHISVSPTVGIRHIKSTGRWFLLPSEVLYSFVCISLCVLFVCLVQFALGTIFKQRSVIYS